MPAVEVNWYRWLLAMVVTGIGLAAFLWLGFYLPSRPGEVEPAREQFPRGIEVSSRRMPQVLIWCYVVMGVFIVIYTIVAWWAKFNY